MVRPGIRSKLLALVAVPMVLLVALSAVLMLQLGVGTGAGGAAERRVELYVVVAALAVLALVALFAALVARRIVRPLRALTLAAESLADELPSMVERMQRPGERPEVDLTPIPVRSRDEIGALARAFNSVNEITVRVAEEQAALRGSIAEMFTNMARRNQVLLDRQLAFLDRLEAREEDPDTLENLFRLDHLATRMRRNSESLLVLADDAHLSRPRAAGDVRSMLSGFRAGVQRGRAGARARGRPGFPHRTATPRGGTDSRACSQ